MKDKRGATITTALGSLTVLLTSGCNLHCRYCYRPSAPERRLAWPDLRRALCWALARAGPRFEILFSGGEPLQAFPMLARTLAFLANRPAGPAGLARLNGLEGPDRPVPSTRPPRIRFKVLTNGTLLTRRIEDVLATYDCELRLSFDGVPVAQDLRGQGTFALLDRRLDGLRRRHREYYRRRLVVVVTVLPETVPHLARSFAYLLDKGVRRIVLAPSLTPMPTIGKTGDATDLPRTVEALEEQFVRIYRQSLDHYERTGEVVLGLFIRRESSPARTDEANLLLCSLARGTAPAVDVDGTIHACEVFCGAAAAWKDGRYRDLLDLARWGKPGTAAFEARHAAFAARAPNEPILAPQGEKRSAFGRCSSCEHVDECLICPVAIASHGMSADPGRVPDFPCAFHRVAFAHRKRFPTQPWPEEIQRHPAMLAASLDRLLKGLRRPRTSAAGRP
jgi:sulfatase maturation enzyme AslB (radical SAM superfamily)